MQRQKVFVSPFRMAVTPISVLESEWLWLQDRLGQKQKLSINTRKRLLKVTDLYASSLREPGSRQMLQKICSDIEAWSERTNRLRNMIWKKPHGSDKSQKLERSKWKTKIKNHKLDLDNILESYLNSDQSQLELQYPLALFDRMLKGSIVISDVIVNKLRQDTDVAREARLWFIWAALVMSILHESGVAVRHPTRENLLNGPVEVLAMTCP